MKRLALMSAVATFAFGFIVAGTALANNAWGNYHWARTSNPFTLKLGDNVSTAWDSYLATASNDWTQSSVLNTTVVPGQAINGAICAPSAGRVEVCNAKYGPTGWVGIAQIWTDNNSHIVQARAAMNDYYLSKKPYNTPAWKRYVMCQEVGHALGLDHQNETSNNANLGSCMDYTNDPDGGAGGASASDPSNEHPNAHDYAQLEAIYADLDIYNSYDTSSPAALPGGPGRGNNLDDPSGWGRLVSGSAKGSGGSVAVYARDLGGGQKLITFVIWAE